MEAILAPLLDGILQYIYGEYVLAIVAVTELMKYYLDYPTIVRRLHLPKWMEHPKWMTLLVALALGVVMYFFKENLDWNILIISLGISTVGYDYFIKPLIDLIKSFKKKDA